VDFFALLAAPPTGGLSLLLSLLAKLLSRIKPGREMPSRARFPFYVLLYFFVLVNVSYAIPTNTNFWATTEYQFVGGAIIILVFCPLAIIRMIEPIERYLKLDKWTNGLRWWIRAPLIFGFFIACIFVQSSTGPELDTRSGAAYLTPYFGELQIQVESRSPHLAVLRISSKRNSRFWGGMLRPLHKESGP